MDANSAPMRHREALLETFELQNAGFTLWSDVGAPFYGALGELMRDDVERGGPIADLFAPFADRSFEDGYILRFLSGVHRCVLRGNAPELGAHYPSVGGDGDAVAAFPHVRALAGDPPPDVQRAMTRRLQTNEVGRSVPLASGLAVIADLTGFPIRLREIGSSGGLNLQLDSYRYEQGDAGWGDPLSPVRFIDRWSGGTPPFDAGAVIVDRRGCDLDPIDPTDDEGALTLLSYVWPQPPERFERARHAIEIASKGPRLVDRADAGNWLRTQLEHPREQGTVLVVQHSVVWQYLEPSTRDDIEQQIRAAGDAASVDTPLAWLRLEPRPVTYLPGDLTLTLWDGSEPDPPDRLLATSDFFGGVVEWLGSAD